MNKFFKGILHIKRLLIFISLTTPGCQIVHSQENHFSQFYTAPQTLNPAFAGDAHYMRAGGISRVMAALPDEKFYNSTLHFDTKILNQHSGIGILFHSHINKLQHQKLQLNYAYTLRLNKAYWIKGGLGASLNIRSSKARNLTYPDQFNLFGFTGQPSSETELTDNAIFPGLNTGVILYAKFWWLSIAGDYLNFPKEDFAGQKSNFPPTIKMSGGFLYPLVSDKTTKRIFSKFGGLKPYQTLGPVFNYLRQNKYSELSIGIATNIQPIFASVHYRYQKDGRISNSKPYNGLSISSGFRQEEFALSYTYDISFSTVTINKNGAHELGFIWYFSTIKEDLNRHRLVPLPNQILY